MKNDTVKICKKDACITASGDNADLLVAVVSAVIIGVAAAYVAKLLS